jgi:diacylglycerol kinase (ATP)
LLNYFNRYLNPIQVINILDEGLTKLNLFTKLKNLKLLIAGGDGTIGSIINYIKQEIPEWNEDMPSIAILPLGTGNDLSISLGWGASFSETDV